MNNIVKWFRMILEVNYRIWEKNRDYLRKKWLEDRKIWMKKV